MLIRTKNNISSGGSLSIRQVKNLLFLQSDKYWVLFYILYMFFFDNIPLELILILQMKATIWLIFVLKACPNCKLWFQIQMTNQIQIRCGHINRGKIWTDFQPLDSSLPMVEEDIELNLESRCLLQRDTSIKLQVNGPCRCSLFDKSKLYFNFEI